jgi:hypothetical protein
MANGDAWNIRRRRCVLMVVRGVRVFLVCGVLLALPLMAATQSEPEPDPTPTEIVEPTDIATEMADPNAPLATDMADPNAPTTRSIEASAVESPFAHPCVSDAAPVVDEAAPHATATPWPHEKLPPGPPSRWP